MEMHSLLKTMVEKGASDLFITAGVPPSMKLHGKMTPVANQPLSPEATRELVLSTMNQDQRNEFAQQKELNFAVSARGVGRFRASAFYQRNLAGMVLRRIETRIPSVDSLGLPDVIKDLAMTKRGLIIFVGATGTGKSTSLASMIGHRNENSRGHIISIEDPIEFIHQHKGCLITQREVGIDTESFEVALKNTLRQAPDVIMIGEVRTRETMEHAISFAETGHLAMATLHANSSNQALDRIINFFPEERKQQLLMDLSLNLKAVISQRLVKTPDGKGRRAAIEILLNSPLISDLIHKGDVHEIKNIMAKSRELGMQTFDQALFDLQQADEISYEEALRNADSVNELRLKIKLEGKDAKESDKMAGLDHLSLEEDEEESGMLK